LDSVRASRTAGQASCFLQQNRGRGALGFESEATVTVYSDDHRSRQAWLLTLGTGVEGLAEFHDVHTVLTQCWANGWAWVGLAGLNLQLDVSLNLLSHELLQNR